MPKKRRTAHRIEMLSCNIAVSSVGLRISRDASTPRRGEPIIQGQPWLEIRGTATEPIEQVRDVAINVYPTETNEVGSARPAAIGAIISARPTITAVIPFDLIGFPSAWSLALSGQLKHAHLVMTRPRYGKALVTDVSFSNEPEE